MRSAGRTVPTGNVDQLEGPPGLDNPTEEAILRAEQEKEDADRAVALPFHTHLSEDQIEFIVATMKDAQRYSSDEVTAIYDNASRQAVVLGSITHDVWKTLP